MSARHRRVPWWRDPPAHRPLIALTAAEVGRELMPPLLTITFPESDRAVRRRYEEVLRSIGSGPVVLL